jgi:HSP20 family protein
MNELTSLHSAMDRLFGDIFGDALWSPTGDRGRAGMATYRLPVDIVQTDQGYRIHAPVPGVRPEDVEVTFSDGVLSIKAKRTEEQTRPDGSYLRRELVFGEYQRQIMLPGDVRAEDIRASFDNGMLMVEVPRAPRPQPARIEVQRGQPQRGQPQAAQQQRGQEQRGQEQRGQQQRGQQVAGAPSRKS